jgi:FtsH-binding integral membrane protein
MARYDEITPDRAFTTPYAADERVTIFLRAVYGWMALGLAVTAAVAWFIASSENMVFTIIQNRALFWGVMIAQLGIVFWLSARVQHMAPGMAASLFLLYSALTGVTFAVILYAFTQASVATTFFVTAGTFGSMAAYGTMTRRSLAGWGQFLFMGLVGVVIASVVGIFWQNDAFQFVLSFIGVILFTALTAYDAQRLKEMALSVSPERAGSYAIVGALKLYLDFINLFLFLLRFTGNRRS